jgi:hypothetical protein
MSQTYDALPSSPSYQIQPVSAQGAIERLSLKGEKADSQADTISVLAHEDNVADAVAAPMNSTESHSMSTSCEDIRHAVSPEDSPPSQLKGFSFSDWWWEIVSWAIGTLVFFMLLALLGFFKNRSLSSWHSKVSLNAMISALGQLAQSAFAVSLASCLGQLKWDWLRARKSISDIEIFDEASRGPLGSLLLIWEQGFKARTL